MLKCRIIPTLLHKDIGLVKGRKFDSWRRVGSALQSVRVYNLRDVDELLFLDISATPSSRIPDLDQIIEITKECFMPVTVGGGVRSLEHMENLLRVGADKIAINTSIIEQPDLLKKGADRFGRQCMVASIDVKKNNDTWDVYSHCGQKRVPVPFLEIVTSIEDSGAGEIILTSIDKDGTMEGYDLSLIKAVTQKVRIPVIASGGAGNYQHMVDAVNEAGANAVAAASIFHFTQMTHEEAKQCLGRNGVPIRTVSVDNK